MSPRNGMLAVCIVAALGGIGLIGVGLVNVQAGLPTVAVGCCTIALACIGALNALGGGK